jgi:glutathione S-transferase
MARFVYLDEHLRSNEYLMGHDYSVADAHFFVISNWASWVKFDLSPYTSVASYRKRIGARAAVRSAMDAEGLIPWPTSPP